MCHATETSSTPPTDVLIAPVSRTRPRGFSVEDDHVLARIRSGFQVGLGFSHAFEAVVGLGDADLQSPISDGLELVLKRFGWQVGGRAACRPSAGPRSGCTPGG